MYSISIKNCASISRTKKTSSLSFFFSKTNLNSYFQRTTFFLCLFLCATKYFGGLFSIDDGLSAPFQKTQLKDIFRHITLLRDSGDSISNPEEGCNHFRPYFLLPFPLSIINNLTNSSLPLLCLLFL